MVDVYLDGDLIAGVHFSWDEDAPSAVVLSDLAEVLSDLLVEELGEELSLPDDET